MMNDELNVGTTPPIEETLTPKKKKAPKPVNMKVDGAARVKIRSTAENDDDDNVIGTLDRGTVLKAFKEPEAFGKVEFLKVILADGRTGYVMKNYLVQA